MNSSDNVQFNAIETVYREHERQHELGPTAMLLPIPGLEPTAQHIHLFEDNAMMAIEQSQQQQVPIHLEHR